MNEEIIELGDMVVDQVSGMKGIASGVCIHLQGCATWAVHPKMKEDGTFLETKWFDEGRLKIIEKGVVEPDTINAEIGRLIANARRPRQHVGAIGEGTPQDHHAGC